MEPQNKVQNSMGPQTIFTKKTQELRKKPKKMEKKGNKVEKAVSFGRNKFISGY